MTQYYHCVVVTVSNLPQQDAEITSSTDVESHPESLRVDVIYEHSHESVQYTGDGVAQYIEVDEDRSLSSDWESIPDQKCASEWECVPDWEFVPNSSLSPDSDVDIVSQFSSPSEHDEEEVCDSDSPSEHDNDEDVDFMSSDSDEKDTESKESASFSGGNGANFNLMSKCLRQHRESKIRLNCLRRVARNNPHLKEIRKRAAYRVRKHKIMVDFLESMGFAPSKPQ